MEPIELLDIISKGENSTVQFKERLPNPDSLAAEMVAFSNTEGGIIIIGVNDKNGALNGLSFQELQSINGQLVDIATHRVFPPINIKTDTVTANSQNLLLVYINEGPGKPYKDHNGIIWVKNGSDKRKVISNEELMRMLQSSGNLAADEELIANTTYNDLDIDFFKSFVLKKTGKNFNEIGQSLSQILNNMGFAKNEKLTLAGLLMFGKKPQSFKPLFSVQCVSFVGNDISGKEYRDSEPPFEGNLSQLYELTLSFITRNLHTIQVEKSFNSIGDLEIPREALEELIVNAFIHRDYFIKSAIKVFIFDNRIEIISPGKLPNTLTVEKIKLGTSIVRNPILFSNARYLLPYIGIGSGIPRAYSVYPNLELVNDIERELFIATIKRPVV